MVPTESNGQVAFEGNRNELITALDNYLLSLYGPKRYKVTNVDQATEVKGPLIRLPIVAIQSQEEH